MATLTSGIAGSIEPMGSYTKPPKGLYECRIISTEDVTKDGEMKFQAVFQIVGPAGNPAIGEKFPKNRTTWRYPKAKDNKTAAEDGINAIFLKLIMVRQNLDGKEGIAKARTIAPQFDPVQHMLNQPIWVNWRPESRPYTADDGSQRMSDDIDLLTQKEYNEAVASASGATASGTSAGGAGAANPFGPTAGAAGAAAANAFMNGAPATAPVPAPAAAPVAEPNPFN